MQRVFDVENEQDMQDLWNILPDNVDKIESFGPYNRFYNSSRERSRFFSRNYNQSNTYLSLSRFCHFFNCPSRGYERKNPK